MSGGWEPGGSSGGDGRPPAAACARVLRALEDCRTKHPRQPEVCKHLEQRAGWCLFRQMCPEEVESVEACTGRGAGRGPAGATLPPAVPRRCHQQVMGLESCISYHQTLAELEQQQQQERERELAREEQRGEQQQQQVHGTEQQGSQQQHPTEPGGEQLPPGLQAQQAAAPGRGGEPVLVG